MRELKERQDLRLEPRRMDRLSQILKSSDPQILKFKYSFCPTQWAAMSIVG